MDCPEARALLQAAADGELGPADTLRLDAHLARCPMCAAQLASIRALRAFVAQAVPYHRAPAGLHARVLHSLPPVDATAGTTTAHPARESGRGPGVGNGQTPGHGQRSRLAGLLDWFDWGPRVNAGLAMLTVAAVGLALAQFALRESPTASFERELVSSHVRALVSGHGIDVASSDRHTVKPWFNGRLDYAPDVPDLAAQGFPLVGGRLDYVDGQRVAVMVYRRNQHPINVFAFPAGMRGPASALSLTAKPDMRQGYQIASWQAAGIGYWAVTDASAEDLRAFGVAWREAAATSPR